MFRTPLIALVLFLVPLSASAVTVSGFVRDEFGFGIANVDLDFFDRDTGQIIFTPFDDTDATGFYSVDVPASRYDITFDANDPTFLEREIRDVDIEGPMTLDTFLYFASLITGHVQNEAGTPLPTVDLNFVDVATGDPFTANDDNTDLAGDFAVLVPGLTFDIYFTAPLGQPYAGLVLPAVTVQDTTDIGTVTLPPGLAVTGQVLRPGGTNAPTMDTDFFDAATGDLIYTPRDDLSATGALNVLVPAGTYDVTFKPAVGTGWAWKTVPDVAVAGPTSLGTVQLETGFAVTGVVQDESLAPVAIADLDMVDLATGKDRPTPDDNTTVTGAFSLLSSATTFDLHVRPPAGAPLAGAVLRDVIVTGPLSVGTITLPAGFVVSGVVRDGVGTPVAEADFDVVELATGDAFPIVGDDSDPLGNYSFRLPGGSWTVIVNAPPGSGLPSSSFDLNPLAGPVVQDVTLGGVVDAPEIGRDRPALRLSAAPNPFRHGTDLTFVLPSGVLSGRLSVVDASGRLVRAFPADASGRVVWDGRDGAGRRVASGVYFYRLEAGDRAETRKVTRIR